MSKQKVVTNLLLSTAVLGGFLICHVPSVSAETGNLQEIPTESATVSSENQTATAVRPQSMEFHLRITNYLRQKRVINRLQKKN